MAPLITQTDTERASPRVASPLSAAGWRLGPGTTARAVGAALALSVIGSLLVIAPAEASANARPGAPTLVSPRNGETLSANSPQLFTIEASDPDGDPYTGWVTVTDATSGRVTEAFRTSPAPSGQASSGLPTDPLPPGSYTWTASASDLLGNTGPEATPQSFSVAGWPDAGGGAFTGDVSFSPALPAVGQSCVATTFSVSGTSGAALISLAPAQFAGFINFTGSGSSTCENAARGSGTLTLSAEGLGAIGARLSCPELTGGYLHVATQFIAGIGGACTINSVTDTISLSIIAELVPSGGAGVTGPIATAAFDGGFTVAPVG